MWVLKFHGETYYVHHVDAKLPWSTKETPGSSHTKGSLKFKNALVTINEDNEATLTELTVIDKFRLRNQKLGITRIIFEPGTEIYTALENNEFKHSPFKYINGACSTEFIVCDLLDKQEVTVAALKYGDFRILQSNETYYKQYDTVEGDSIDVDYSHPDTLYEYS